MGALFIVVYHYHVPPERAKEYVLLERRAVEICLEHGCLAIELYRDAEDPSHWMEIEHFRDEEHYLKVKEAVEGDERMKRLYEELTNLIDVERCHVEKETYLRML